MEIFSQPKRTVFFQNALFLCKKKRFLVKREIYSSTEAFLQLLYTHKFLLQSVNADGNHYGKYNNDDDHEQRRPCIIKAR